jgi:60 kDa SS-A/Ro ribonucleoprotein
MAYLRTINTRRNLRDNETLSHNLGIVSKADIWTQLRRFLILGTEGGSYYQSEHKLTIQNIKAVADCLGEDAGRTVHEIMSISDAGRAPSNDPAILALAIASISDEVLTRQLAWGVFGSVVRTGTHLLHFVAYRKALGGTGCYSFKRAIERWFTKLDDEDKLTYQMVKYQSRDGMSMRDVLRLAHPRSNSFHLEALYTWVTKGEVRNDAPDMIKTYAMVHQGVAPDSRAQLVADSRLPWEALPTDWLKQPDVWEALLPTMGMTAMVRNLGRMTSIGLIEKGGTVAFDICARLQNEDQIRKSRIHPMQLLVALKTYEQGHGTRGSLKWGPAKNLISHLDEAFYLSFGNVEPTGKNLLLGVDVSGSMGHAIGGMEFLDCRTAAAALALVTANVEPNYTVMGFDSELYEYNIRPSMRLDEVLRSLPQHGLGTYCHLPITYAIDAGEKYDAFVMYTDSENGGRSVTSAIGEYRGRINPEARLVINAMVANRVSIGDPDDSLSLDVVGFDTSAPSVISDFVAGII